MFSLADLRLLKLTLSYQHASWRCRSFRHSGHSVAVRAHIDSSPLDKRIVRNWRLAAAGPRGRRTSGGRAY